MAERTKRVRIRFSCTHCREKKLKCNRQQPCDQCEKRDVAGACEFLPYQAAREPGFRPQRLPSSRDSLTSSGSPATSNEVSQSRPPIKELATLQARLRHLEHVIQVLKSQRKDAIQDVSLGQDKQRSDRVMDELDEQDARADDQLRLEAFGTVNESLRYTDSANWEAILNDISSMTRDLQKLDDDIRDGYATIADDNATGRQQGLVLFQGMFPRTPVLDFFQFVPPRPIMDRILSQMFQMQDPGGVIIHFPTFIQQYEKFWTTPPENTTYIWLGFLFAMISHTAMYCLARHEEMPGNLGPTVEVFEAFRIRTGHCLSLGDYANKPDLQKVQLLIMYFGIEYLSSNDAMLATSALLTLIIRLAMHIGLQRDPQHDPDLSPFEGEMRRRVWTFLAQMDGLISFQFGLPCNIKPGFFDTELPRNLHDHDFSEHTTELPPSRPETELTVVLYFIVKTRVMRAFEAVTAAVTRGPVTYNEIMRLDEMLEDAHASVPEPLRYRSFGQSLMDRAGVIMQRYNLELLYQKARCVLHRKYLVIARSDPRFRSSRLACLDAATSLLRHQYDIHAEIQPDGRLAKDRWFLNSLSSHDFLLATMILCLELSHLNQTEEMESGHSADGPNQKGDDGGSREEAQDDVVLPREVLLDMLRISRSIWQTAQAESTEAKRAAKILSRMLELSTGELASIETHEHRESPESMNPLPSAESIQHLTSRLGISSSSTGSSPFGISPWGTNTSLNAPASGTSRHQHGLQQLGSSIVPAAVSDPSLLPDAQTSAMAWTGNITRTPATAESLSMEGGGWDTLMEPILESDWNLWDSQILSGASTEMPQLPWDSFFQSSSNAGP